jgi:hypothetical protein
MRHLTSLTKCRDATPELLVLATGGLSAKHQPLIVAGTLCVQYCVSELLDEYLSHRACVPGRVVRQYRLMSAFSEECAESDVRNRSAVRQVLSKLSGLTVADEVRSVGPTIIMQGNIEELREKTPGILSKTALRLTQRTNVLTGTVHKTLCDELNL